jgi:transketolase
VLLGDGECNEGSVWEAAMSAVKFGLKNIVAIVDQNNLQSDGACEEIFCTAPLEKCGKALGGML